MPKTPIDFSKTVIYKICCNNPVITDIYIGHTTDLRRRRYEHKSHCNNEKSKQYNLKEYQFIRENGGWANWTLIPIEEYSCNNVNEARTKERYWIETLKPSLNSDIPNRSEKEYREENKEVIAKKKKEYREKNKEVIAKKSKEYYEENKDKIIERVKQYTEENKEVIAEYRKQYQIDNKEKLAEKKKEYREENKEIINKKACERIKCYTCNCDVPKRHISTHNKTLKHLSHL
jgi:hypothetical protein